MIHSLSMLTGRFGAVGALLAASACAPTVRSAPVAEQPAPPPSGYMDPMRDR